MFITIAGDLGSGKSSVGKIVAKKLNYEFLSVGGLMRELAQEEGLSIVEFSKKAETDGGKIDELLDKKQQELGKQKDKVIFDARLGWYFIPKSLKIYLKVDIDVSAQRIFNDARESEKENQNIETTKQKILERKQSEKQRYKKYYGIDFDAPQHFDIIIDTTKKTIEEVAQIIIDEVNKKE